jgi:hypothetical protein
MATNRLDREVDNREFSERPKRWMPAELLPEPDKQAGYAYRWVRTSTLNTADPRNLSAKLREGWEPVSIEFVTQRNAYYAKQSDAQTDAVDNNLMRQSDPRMPLFNERKSTTSFGKGNN